MAKKLKDFDFENEPITKSSKYAWDEWLNGDIWQLTEGTDFTVKRNSFKISCGQNAKKRNLKLRISEVDNGFVIQAYKTRRGRPRKKV